MEQAYPLLFLCSDAASGISGITLITDAGYMHSGITGSFPNATMMQASTWNDVLGTMIGVRNAHGWD